VAAPFSVIHFALFRDTTRRDLKDADFPAGRREVACQRPSICPVGIPTRLLRRAKELPVRQVAAAARWGSP
jgi:hypothetical protein